MWWEIEYQPTTLFSLKKSEATNAAGKSLLLPSPYSVKMALLNAICTYDTIELAKENFELIKDLQMEFSLSEYIVVNNCFIRIMQESRAETRKENPNILFKSTVAFREYLFYSGKIKIAFKDPTRNVEKLTFLKKYFYKINYFGKRSCFFQMISFSENPLNELPQDYSRAINDLAYLSDGRQKILCKVDDFGKNVSFENVSSFSDEKTERISKVICLPYKSTKSNKNFTLFERS